MLIAQTKKALQVFEDKYPGKQGRFIFDQAPSHKKKTVGSLDAKRMNVSPGGKQPVMLDTVWNSLTG